MFPTFPGALILLMDFRGTLGGTFAFSVTTFPTLGDFGVVQTFPMFPGMKISLGKTFPTFPEIRAWKTFPTFPQVGRSLFDSEIPPLRLMRHAAGAHLQPETTDGEDTIPHPPEGLA